MAVKEPIPSTVAADDSYHSLKYSTNLPYASRLDGEATEWLQEICRNLTICVEAQDWSPGCLFWVKRLGSYLDMKHAIPRVTRAALAKLLYEMTITCGMEPSLVEIWANSCIRLIRRKKHLNRDDLVLAWRPLYTLIDSTYFAKSREKSLGAESKQMLGAVKLAKHARRFFAPDASAEILQELLPQFTAHSIADAFRVQGYLVHFLPVAVSASASAKDDYSSISKTLPTLFSLWSMLANSHMYDLQFMDLLAAIAEENVHIDDVSEGLQELGIFTHQQVQWIFTVAIRMMNLPVGSASDGSGTTARSSRGPSIAAGSVVANSLRTDLNVGNAMFLHSKSDKFKMLARFIVYTMFPDRETTPNGVDGDELMADGVDSKDRPMTSTTLTHLGNLLQATESFYHPSNNGRWTFSLVMFLKHLAYEFLKRYRLEQEPDCLTPRHRRITDAMKKDFVLKLRGVTFLALYGKEQLPVTLSHSALRYLAWLEPSVIFPGLLERIYPSLETLTEAHRTLSSLGVLSHVVMPMITREHYPAGGKHLLPLLHLTIPGIDMNDPIKTMASLMFVTQALVNVPVKDLTMNDESAGYGGFHFEEAGEDMQLDIEEENALCKASTGEFEEWVAKFMRRVIATFENLPAQGSSTKSSPNLEAGLTQILLHACEVLTYQLSDELYDMVLQMIVDFASDTVIPNAARATGFLCSIITAVAPAKALPKFLSICIRNIETELEHGASSQPSTSLYSEINIDTTLHWYQCILYQVVTVSGTDIVRHKDEILGILDKMMTFCKSRRGYMWAGKLLRHILIALTDLYPLECRSATPSQWSDPSYMQQHHLYWGKSCDPQNLEIQWHIPSKEEIDLAFEVIEKYLRLIQRRMQELRDGTLTNLSSKEISNEFCRQLVYLRNLLLGSITLYQADETDDSSEFSDEISKTLRPSKFLYANYCFDSGAEGDGQRAKRLRQTIGELVHSSFVYLKESREDDIESMKIVIKMLHSFLTDRGVEKSKYDAIKRSYNYAKSMSKTFADKKKYPRYVLVRRVYAHHLLRMKQNAYGRPPGVLQRNMILDLLELSLSPYTEIRKQAQHALIASVRCYLGAKPKVVDALLDELHPHSTKSYQTDRMKGALYLFKSKTLMLTCLRDWRFVPRFILSLCKAQHEDKVSVQDLLRKSFIEYAFNFTNVPFELIPREQIGEISRAVTKSGFTLHNPAEPQANTFTHNLEEVRQKVLDRRKHRKEAYVQLVDDLLVLFNDPLIHWRFRYMVAGFLDNVMRTDVVPSAKFAQFVVDCLVSDIQSLRKVACLSMTTMLLYLKQWSLAGGNETALVSRAYVSPFRVDETTPVPLPERYEQAFLESKWEEKFSASPFVDDDRIGWLAWPVQYKAYRQREADETLFIADDACKATMEQVSKALQDRQYWTQLLSFASQEPSSAHEDKFSPDRARLFKSIFETFERQLVEPFFTEVEEAALMADQKNQQRAVAEMLAGLVRGMKHWAAEDSKAVWAKLVPLLEKIFSSMTPDSVAYWEAFTKYCLSSRDPRRALPLVNIILDFNLDMESNAAFAQTGKQLLLRSVVVTIAWRFTPKSQAVLDTLFNNIAHPYKQVRNAIGTNIDEILQLQWVPGFASVEAFIQHQWSQGDGVGVDLPKVPMMVERLETVLSALRTWKEEAHGKVIIGGSDYVNASKTILAWIHNAFSTWRVAGTIPYVQPVLGEIFEMQDVKDDQDLAHMAANVLQLISQYTYTPQMVPPLIQNFTQIISHHSNWHVRVKALPIVQVFFFKHLFLMESKEVISIMDAVGAMLLDSQIEVRQLAAVTLSGLIRCSQREAIAQLISRFRDLADTQIPQRNRKDSSVRAATPAGFQTAVLRRHAGVLGLSCLVDAFPYEVPSWMPEILVFLAGCVSDPAPIQATVKKTFADFRRTHHDTWHEDMLQFTEDQLSLLSDMLISPSYYA
ncbi:hypothetical protein BZG36_03001 [Bifiguratus adelaidae]|uniref:Proteasome activator Blm10 mid region domain-containing protein n=1 Tax=Bifiguratus adelaidae TaxID=1938954 RepID=A0A261XZK5_9FUNG|nr:hypothetical protein BZG36_03001 [Bifiguratus adelaidae]